MSDTPVILSISMLASGKEDMPKSLKSLLYFKNAFPCEIILVDTGCNAEMRALVEQYADKIVDFTWCNDFAAARNAGLREAGGEWFMFLDDDEWFDNPQEIIDFFVSGEYKDYNSASYVARNYMNAAGTMYEDSFPSRMVKLRPDTRFVGKVHERLEPFPRPRKAFSDFVHHYGYVYKSEEQRRKHAQRNIQPLLQLRKEHPGDPRWYCQLAQEYFSVEEYEKTIEACKEGLQEWRALEDQGDYAPAFVGATYAYIVISLECLASYEEEERWLKEAFEDPLSKLSFMSATVAFYCLVAARMYSKTNRYELCREYFRRYLEYYKRLKDERELLEIGTSAVVSGVFQENLLYGVVLMSMESLLRTEDYRLAEEAFYLLDWSDRRLLHQEKWERSMVDACCSVPFHPTFAKIMQTLVSREEGMKEMYVIFLDAEVRYRQQGETESLLRLQRLVAELDCDHRYVLCSKILWTARETGIGETERRQRAGRLFGQLFERYPRELFEVRAEIWDVARQLQVELEPLVLETDFRCWRSGIESWCAEASLENISRWDGMIASWKRRSDIRYDFFVMKCLEGYLRRFREAELAGERLEQVLMRYADSVLAYYGAIYRESAFSEAPEILPGEAQLALQLGALRQCRERGEDAAAPELLRGCMGLYPALDPAVAQYARMCRDELQRRGREAEEAREELVRLAETLKRTASQLLEKGQLQAAREILLQVRKCLPEDEEAARLLRRTEAAEGAEGR